tara:strand:- start:405 stop:650 length:246 start_codon:yes stop_codon:yes gene_type:complete
MNNGTAKTVINITTDDGNFDIEVTISGLFFFDWNFEDEDIEFDSVFDDWRNTIINRVRSMEHRLNFRRDGSMDVLSEYDND